MNGGAFMYDLDIGFEEFIAYGNLVDFPREVREVLRVVYQDIRNSRGKRMVPADFSDNFFADFNLIPSKSNGDCRPLLVGVCYYDDNIDTRLRKCLDHVASKCDGINKELFFLSTKWNSAVIDKYIGYIQSLRHNGVKVNMIYVSRRGVVLMPI
jgi:hypothetical protein